MIFTEAWCRCLFASMIFNAWLWQEIPWSRTMPHFLLFVLFDNLVILADNYTRVSCVYIYLYTNAETHIFMFILCILHNNPNATHASAVVALQYMKQLLKCALQSSHENVQYVPVSHSVCLSLYFMLFWCLNMFLLINQFTKSNQSNWSLHAVCSQCLPRAWLQFH